MLKHTNNNGFNLELNNTDQQNTAVGYKYDHMSYYMAYSATAKKQSDKFTNFIARAYIIVNMFASKVSFFK